jgi:hypothetical protein
MRESLTALSLLVLAAGCIPSHRIVHQGDRYFEHCYGADFDRRVTPVQNEACWQAWIAHYTRHQPAHRVDYAMRRVEALQAGEPALRLPGMQQSGVVVDVDPAQQAMLASAQQANQPKLENSPESEGGKVSVPNGCLDACNGYEGRCLGGCESNNVSCRHDCARERAICLGGCY